MGQGPRRGLVDPVVSKHRGCMVKAVEVGGPVAVEGCSLLSEHWVAVSQVFRLCSSAATSRRQLANSRRQLEDRSRCWLDLVRVSLDLVRVSMTKA